MENYCVIKSILGAWILFMGSVGTCLGTSGDEQFDEYLKNFTDIEFPDPLIISNEGFMNSELGPHFQECTVSDYSSNFSSRVKILKTFFAEHEFRLALSMDLENSKFRCFLVIIKKTGVQLFVKEMVFVPQTSFKLYVRFWGQNEEDGGCHVTATKANFTGSFTGDDQREEIAPMTKIAEIRLRTIPIQMITQFNKLFPAEKCDLFRKVAFVYQLMHDDPLPPGA